MRGHVLKQQGFRAKGGDGGRKGEGVGKSGGWEARGLVSGERRAGKCNGGPTVVATGVHEQHSRVLLTGFTRRAGR